MNKEVAPVWKSSSWPRTVRCPGRYEQIHGRGEAATIFPATALVSSRALSKAYTAGYPGRLSDYLTPWHELVGEDAFHIEKFGQHDYNARADNITIYTKMSVEVVEFCCLLLY